MGRVGIGTGGSDLGVGATVEVNVGMLWVLLAGLLIRGSLPREGGLLERDLLPGRRGGGGRSQRPPDSLSLGIGRLRLRSSS
jgi:hypothetical protein